MPSLPDIISALNRLSHFSDGQYWKVASHNNTPIGPVVHVDTGLKNTHLWARARFQENGQEMEVYGERDVFSHHIKVKFGPSGSAGDVDRSDEIVLSNRLVTTEWRVVLEFVFEKGGKTERYRFDGTAVKADDIIKGILI